MASLKSLDPHEAALIMLRPQVSLLLSIGHIIGKGAYLDAHAGLGPGEASR